jgi:hypothetical protein
VTFADSVLHLVRAGARIDSRRGSQETDSSDAAAALPADPLVGAEAVSVASQEPGFMDIELVAQAAQAAQADQAEQEFEPALGDLEAAVALVSAGLATRVVLSNFTSWPGLLWRAYQLAETEGVLILPTVVRPGGRVDIVITRDVAANG